jgi:integrase
VPERLQEAVAHVLNTGEARRVFLKKSLSTKSLKKAKAAAPLVLADFNRIVGEAEALLDEQPVVTTLTDTQIKRMAESHYAGMLGRDEYQRREGTGGLYTRVLKPTWNERMLQIVEKQSADADASIYAQTEALPEAGLSDREIAERQAVQDATQSAASAALARGDITVIRSEVESLLSTFRINLDPKSPAYRKLGMAVLNAEVRAWKDIERRNAGEPIETPQTTYTFPGDPRTSHGGGTLREALEGWKNERDRPEDSVHEYTRAAEMFIELHGNIAIANIKRSHASQFRDALRQVPKTRKGPLLKAGLLELRQWGQEHPSAPKVSSATVNKQLGAVQAIISWGFRNGLVPDEVPWADPFKNARLEGEQSTRDAFDPRGLQIIFDAPLFSRQEVPEGGKGPAAVWLPLLAMFMGGRQGEFAALRVSDIREDTEIHIPLLWIIRDAAAGKRVKTDAGERVVPIHPQIIQLGFLDYVAERKAEDGDKAWLFPPVAPDQRGGRKAWAKWWGRYLRTHIGVEDPNLVFHSFRHGFQDALRRATPDEELRDALAGRSAAGKSVSRQYGAKQMLQRWGVQRLYEVICAVSFPGLDLSRVKPLGISRTRARGALRN